MISLFELDTDVRLAFQSALRVFLRNRFVLCYHLCDLFLCLCYGTFENIPENGEKDSFSPKGRSGEKLISVWQRLLYGNSIKLVSILIFHFSMAVLTGKVLPNFVFLFDGAKYFVYGSLFYVLLMYFS